VKLAAIITLALVAGSTAQTSARTVRVAGVELPDAKQVGQTRLYLNGAGVHEASMFDVDVYVAGLYAEKPSSNASRLLDSEQTIQLSLRFKRDVDRKALIKAAKKGMKKQLGSASTEFGDEIAALEQGLRDLRKGDTLSMTYDKGVGVRVGINERACGQVIAGDDFGRALFANWLGPRPVSRKLKARLLGGH
jgi:hypothetical protein